MIRLVFTTHWVAYCLMAALLAVVPATASFAAEPLPGVTQGEPIAQPLPPESDKATPSEKKPIRVGDWDVRISGSVTVDIGVGALRRPAR